MTENKELFSHAATVLPVDNVVETTAFYKRVLGFEITLTYGDPPYYAIARRGDHVNIHFSEREDTSKKINPCAVYVFVNDVDAVYEEYHSRGVEIFAPPDDQEHGMREFDVRDMNGHFLTFGQTI